MDGTLNENESVCVCVRVADFLRVCCYHALPQAHSSDRRHQVHDDDGDLHLRHVDPAWTPHVHGGAEQVRLEIKKNKKSNNLQAKAHCPGHVGLPLGAEEHEHPHETTEEHPVRVQAYSAGNARSHGNKD